MVDRDRLQYRLELLAEYLVELRRLRALDLDAYLRDADTGRYLAQAIVRLADRER